MGPTPAEVLCVLNRESDKVAEARTELWGRKWLQREVRQVRSYRSVVPAKELDHFLRSLGQQAPSKILLD
jgi:hypothetical protein